MTPALDVSERNNAIIILIVVFSAGFHTHMPGFLSTWNRVKLENEKGNIL